MSEMWAPIAGYEGSYEVSDLGRVRSIERRVQSAGRNTFVRGRILRLFKDDKGYPMVGLCRDNKKWTAKVHRLVAEAFVPGDKSLTVNHRDMCKSNNAAANLEWVSRDDNLAEAWEHGTHCPHRNPLMRRKLTPEAVEMMKRDRAGGATYRQLGDKYGVTHVNARAVVVGLAWK